MGLYNVILGLILLLFGRKLFWLFVAIAGFLGGMELARVFLVDQARWILVVVALGAGLLGALLAILVERVAFAFAGFFAGAYLGFLLAQSLGAAGASTVLFFVGGVIGAVFAALIMDPAIIFLSCLVGAGAVVGELGLGEGMSAAVYFALVIAGVLVQGRLMSSGGKSLHSRKRYRSPG